LALDILHQPSARHFVGWRDRNDCFGTSWAAQRQRFDPFGAALLAAASRRWTLALSFAPEWGWSSWRFLVCFGVSVVALLAVPAVERRVRDPIIDLRLLQSRVFTSALLSMTLAMLALFAVGFMLPFLFRGNCAASRWPSSGLFLTALPLSLAIVAPASGSLADRFGSRWLASGGLALACFVLVLVAQLNASKLGLGHNMATRAHWCRPGPFHDSECTRADERRTHERARRILLACCQRTGARPEPERPHWAGAIFAGPWRRRGRSGLIEARTDHLVVEGAINATQLRFLTGFHTSVCWSVLVSLRQASSPPSFEVLRPNPQCVWSPQRGQNRLKTKNAIYEASH